jgi:hypothetical protein
MGEGGDGGVRVADITPTFVLPHPGGGNTLRKYVTGVMGGSTQA